MTVAELIEKLQALPGASEFRPVMLKVEAHRERLGSIRCEVWNITDVRIDATKAVIEGWGWDEDPRYS